MTNDVRHDYNDGLNNDTWRCTNSQQLSNDKVGGKNLTPGVIQKNLLCFEKVNCHFVQTLVCDNDVLIEQLVLGIFGKLPQLHNYLPMKV